jgi:anti-sigma regulatory factor (Ser/Thr protein kinase)/DNA-binding XRE family transcriptional regulator
MYQHGHPTPQTARATPLVVWSRTFPATAQQVREARRFLAAILEDCPATEDALLCLSELVTNALLHSRSSEPGGSFAVQAQRHGNRLRVEVRDQGGPWATPAPTDPAGQNGRGLAILDQLSHAWGRSGDETGWTVWFETGQDPPQRWITLLDGQRLRQLRRHHALTRGQLAAKAGISSATITRLESNPRPACRCRTLARLAVALGTAPAALIPYPAAQPSRQQPTPPESTPAMLPPDE